MQTVKSAKRLVERERPEVWDILGEIIQGHPVLLNRAPTLHRLGIQGFEPVLVEGKAIRIHPLVCAAFNADFDGDQMAVHVPLSFEAQIEVSLLMLATHNILSPASGRPLATPSQDIVLGCYYLTKSEREDADPKGLRAFYGATEVRAAVDAGAVRLHEPIRVKRDGQLVVTTAGRVLFNESLPPGLGFVNRTLDRKALENLVSESYSKLGPEQTAPLLDDLKDLGFEYATRAGITVGIDDFLIPPAKAEIVRKASEEIAQIAKHYRAGAITEGERYNKVIDAWTHATTEVEQVTFEDLAKERDGFNPIYMMADSGARGSREQIRQLCGMRGLMAKPQKKITGGLGEIIESPVIHNFKEGLTVLEYFISTHGARKGLADTALKTADAGYLTRRLVDVGQDVIINLADCHTIRGLAVGPLKDGEEIIQQLSDRVLGRVVVEDVYHPITTELVVEAGQLLDESVGERLDDATKHGLEKIRIRSVLTCDAKRGVCGMCYGRNLANGQPVNLGEAVGVIAAQSIGEPGTQLTLRTFHIGGTASHIVVQSKIQAKTGGVVRFIDVETVDYLPPEGTVAPVGIKVVVGHRGEIEVVDPETARVRQRYNPPYGAQVFVSDHETVIEGQTLFEWDTYNKPVITEKAGVAQFVDIREKITVRDEVDEVTGLKLQVIMEDRNKELHPAIDILDDKNKTIAHYPLPTGSRLQMHDGQRVVAGQALVKIRRETSKTRDITGGLPRVSELFEARRPKDAAVVSEIDGRVELGGVSRGLRKVAVRGDSGEGKEYSVPQGRHLHVQEGSFVRAGERLTEGPINPHDILRIKGIEEVQEYLVNEIQEVYRLQGVRIDDKHIEVIVRQMLQKVRVEDPGDTTFLEGEQVDRIVLADENERARTEGLTPATYQPLLLGITKASLSTQSFISAASFQETTRVLTEAAIQGATDHLRGLKENVIIGHLIPAGTGMPVYRKLKLESELTAPEEAPVAELTGEPKTA